MREKQAIALFLLCGRVRTDARKAAGAARSPGVKRRWRATVA